MYLVVSMYAVHFKVSYILCRQIVLQDKRRQVLAGHLLVAQQALDAFDASFEPQVCAVLFRIRIRTRTRNFY